MRCTGLIDGCGDAVVSIDVVQLLTDHIAMIRETARLVRPHGRIVVTTWEGCCAAPDRFPRDLPRLVEAADLVVDAFTERPGWLERQLRIYRRAAEAEPDSPQRPGGTRPCPGGTLLATPAGTSPTSRPDRT
ncbi:MAG: hypothetical protein ACRDS0_24100 [Pseudonocardiaceae bacterium]